MNSFKLFEFNQKMMLLCLIEAFFILHSIVTESKKDKKYVQNDYFAGNLKNLNEFNIKPIS